MQQSRTRPLAISTNSPKPQTTVASIVKKEKAKSIINGFLLSLLQTTQKWSMRYKRPKHYMSIVLLQTLPTNNQPRRPIFFRVRVILNGERWKQKVFINQRTKQKNSINRITIDKLQ
jgi:hypothetical protein